MPTMVHAFFSVFLVHFSVSKNQSYKVVDSSLSRTNFLLGKTNEFPDTEYRRQMITECQFRYSLSSEAAHKERRIADNL